MAEYLLDLPRHLSGVAEVGFVMPISTGQSHQGLLDPMYADPELVVPGETPTNFAVLSEFFHASTGTANGSVIVRPDEYSGEKVDTSGWMTVTGEALNPHTLNFRFLGFEVRFGSEEAATDLLAVRGIYRAVFDARSRQDIHAVKLTGPANRYRLAL